VLDTILLLVPLPLPLPFPLALLLLPLPDSFLPPALLPLQLHADLLNVAASPIHTLIALLKGGTRGSTAVLF
jgi:hypothetical protein